MWEIMILWTAKVLQMLHKQGKNQKKNFNKLENNFNLKTCSKLFVINTCFNDLNIKKMLREIRKQYEIASLNESDAQDSAILQFRLWLDEAVKSTEAEPTAMIVSTVDEELQPHSRVVLLKDFDENGLVFFTNYESNKGKQLAENNRVAVLFFWQSLERQVRITGKVEKVPEQVSENYFKSRPLDSQIGAFASPQSTVIENKAFLENRFEQIKKQFGENVAKPAHWGGYRIIPKTFEFWQGRPNRLHDRLFYSKTESGLWKLVRLAP